MSSLSLKVVFGQGFEGYPDYRVIIDEECSPADLEAYFLDAAILPDPFEEIRDGGLPVAFSLSFGGKRLNHNQPIVMQGVRQDDEVVFSGQYVRGEEMIREWGSRLVGSPERVSSHVLKDEQPPPADLSPEEAIELQKQVEEANAYIRSFFKEEA